MNIRDIRLLFASRRTVIIRKDELVDVTQSPDGSIHLAKYVSLPYGIMMTASCNGEAAMRWGVAQMNVGCISCVDCMKVLEAS